MFTKIREATKLEEACVYGIFRSVGLWNFHDHTDVRRQSGTLIGRYLVGEGGNSSLEDFIHKEHCRISEEDRKCSSGDIEAGHRNNAHPTSESEESSGENDT